MCPNVNMSEQINTWHQSSKSLTVDLSRLILADWCQHDNHDYCYETLCDMVLYRTQWRRCVHFYSALDPKFRYLLLRTFQTYLLNYIINIQSYSLPLHGFDSSNIPFAKLITLCWFDVGTKGNVHVCQSQRWSWLVNC